MDKLNEIKGLGEVLLARNPDVVPRFRIIRDILEIPSTDPMFTEAQVDLANSKPALELIESQEANGTWGRFHSQDTKDKVKKRFVTTEQAIRQALALGFDRESDVLQNVVQFMVNVLEGKETWSDPPEKHEGWPTGVRLITTATLARIDNRHPAIQKVWESWAEILTRTFISGDYDGEDERKAHQILNGIVTRNKYPRLSSIYPLVLLSSTEGALPKDLETRFLDWIWRKKDGIYYLTWFSLDKCPGLNAKEFPFWLEAIEILSAFDRWAGEHGEEVAELLWNQRNSHGAWDLESDSESAKGAKKYCCFQLSESWRNPLNREIDCTVKILCLLKRLCR